MRRSPWAWVALLLAALLLSAPAAPAQDGLRDLERVARQLIGTSRPGALYAYLKLYQPELFLAADPVGLAELLDGGRSPESFREGLRQALDQAGLAGPTRVRIEAAAEQLIGQLSGRPAGTSVLSAAQVKAGGDPARVAELLRPALYQGDQHWMSTTWEAGSRGVVGVRYVPGELAWFNPYVSIPELGIRAGVPLTEAQKQAVVRLLSVETVTAGGQSDGTAAFPDHVGRAINPNSQVLTILNDRGEVVGDLVTKGPGPTKPEISRDGTMETREGWLEAELSRELYRNGVNTYDALCVIVREGNPEQALLIRAPRSLMRHLDVDLLSLPELERTLARHLDDYSRREGRQVGLREWLGQELPRLAGLDAGRLGGLGVQHGGLVSIRRSDRGNLRRDNVGLGELVDWDKVQVGSPTQEQKPLLLEQVQRSVAKLNQLLPEGQRITPEQVAAGFEAGYQSGWNEVTGKKLAFDRGLLEKVSERDLATMVKPLGGAQGSAQALEKLAQAGLLAEGGAATSVSTTAGFVGVVTGAKPGDDVRWVEPGTLRFSQPRAGGRGRADLLRASLAQGWNGAPVDVVVSPSGLVSIDNTRVAVAQELNLPVIPVRVHQPGEALPEDMVTSRRFGPEARTWGEALAFRTSHQNPVIPPDGTPERPTMPGQPAQPVFPAGPTGGLGEAGGTWVDPATLRFSQRSAGGNGRAALLRESMAAQGWNGPPVDVVETSAGLVSIDNTRVAVAQELGLSKIPVQVHAAGEPLPAEMIASRRFGPEARTWGEALAFRTARQRPPLPKEGTQERPKLPEVVPQVSGEAGGQGSGFSVTRPATGEPAGPSVMPYGAVAGLFDVARSVALERARQRLAQQPGEATWQAGLSRLEATRLEIVESNALLAEAQGETVRVSTGLINALDARVADLPPGERVSFRLRALGLILGHELAHQGGLKAEGAADREAVEVLRGTGLGGLTRAELARVVGAFERPLGLGSLDELFRRLRGLLRYGTSERRVETIARAAEGQPDPLSRFRRADGTLEWSRLVRERALSEAGGLAHFGLALFLKELAQVARTGDRSRVEEFFEGLLQTDFYVEYGLFSLGARAGDVTYSRFLQRYVKPRFVSGVLRTNIVLATGLALPQLVRGQFQGQAFAISLGALGLSSAAVKTGLAGIRWVVDLRRAEATGALARTGLQASRLARLGGWFYTAAELAVVLLLAEDVEQRVHAFLDRRAAERAVREAGEAFAAALRRPGLTRAQVEAAAETWEEAWDAWREYLYRDLMLEEARFAHDLEGLARDAKEAADARQATLERLRRLPALAARAVAQHGSLEAYAAALVADDEARLGRRMDELSADYQRRRDELLDQVYQGPRRDEPLLPAGATLDGLGGATPSGNRLQSWEDQAAALELAAAELRRAGHPELVAGLEPAQTRVSRAARLDANLYRTRGAAGLDLGDPADSRGLSGALRDAGR